MSSSSSSSSSHTLHNEGVLGDKVVHQHGVTDPERDLMLLRSLTVWHYLQQNEQSSQNMSFSHSAGAAQERSRICLIEDVPPPIGRASVALLAIANDAFATDDAVVRVAQVAFFNVVEVSALVALSTNVNQCLLPSVACEV